jgi:PPOX class probable F420-dependent enzyme
MTAEASPEIAAYLREHRLCVFATGRKDGSPQVSLIGYQFDGNDFLLSCQATSFKAKNLRRQPRASLAVTDGRRELLVYGRARIVEDEAEMTALQARFGPREGPPRPQPQAGQAPPPPPRPMGRRVNILFTPDMYIAERMNG